MVDQNSASSASSAVQMLLKLNHRGTQRCAEDTNPVHVINRALDLHILIN